MKVLLSSHKILLAGVTLGLAALLGGCPQSDTRAPAAPVGQAPAAAPASNDSAEASFSYDENLVRVQKHYSGPATAGQPYTFKIVVTALKPTSGVTILQVLPKSVTFQSAYPAAKLNKNGSPVWDLGAMGQGDERTINLVVLPSDLGNFAFRTLVKAQPAATEIVKVGKPELHATLKGPESIELGGTAVWSFLVTNSGSAPARSVMLNAILPSGFQVAGSPSAHVPVLLPGQSTRLSVTATPAEAGIYSANFSASCIGGEPVQRDAQIQVRGSQVRVVMSGPKSRYIFAPATYMITVTNTGGTPLDNLTLIDLLPKDTVLFGAVAQDGEVFANSAEGSRQLELRTSPEGSRGYWAEDGNPLRDTSANLVQWTLPRLNPGQSEVRQLTYYSIAPGAPENTVKVAGPTSSLNASASFKTEWKAIPGIYTTLVDSADPVRIGEKATYTATLLNQSKDANITVTNLQISIPDVLKVESADEGGIVRGNTVTFNGIELGPQQEKKLVVTVSGRKLGTGVAQMKTSTNFHVEPVVNEQSTSVY